MGAFALLCDERKRKGLPTKLNGRDRTALLAGDEQPTLPLGKVDDLHRVLKLSGKKIGQVFPAGLFE
jgi:hypothetical protein